MEDNAGSSGFIVGLHALGQRPKSERYESALVELDNKNSSQALVIEFTGCNKRILEVGTSTGYITKELKRRGNQIIGVEIDKDAGKIASQFCESMIIGDIDELNLDEYLPPESIDVIMLADVLEHLRWPGHLLENAKKYLRPEGYLVVSLPNVTHGDIILNLLCGNFRYTSTGLLDETHLRFFARRNIFDIFNNYGYDITDIQEINIPIGSTELQLNQGLIPPELLKFMKSLPDSDVYQFVFKASPSANPTKGIVSEPDFFKSFETSIDNITKQHESRVNGLLDQLRQTETRVNTLAKEVSKQKQMIFEKDRQISSITMQRAEANNQIKSLENEIAEMRKSMIWQMLMMFQNGFVEKVLPLETRRRACYDQTLEYGRKIIKNKSLNSEFSFKILPFGLRRTKGSRNRIGKKIKLSNNDRISEQINKRVSIVIPTKNAGIDFDYILEKIKHQKGIAEIELIVVDSGSTDETVDIAKRYGASVYKIEPREFNHGATRNYGAEKATGDYILFLVQDAIPIGEYWLHDLTEILEKDQGIAAATCRQVPRNDADLFACFSMSYHYEALDLERSKITSHKKGFDKLSHIDKRKLCMLDDVCCIFSKEYFNRFKFKEIQFAEDLELGIRLLCGGYKLAFLDSVGVVHSHNRNPAYFLRRSYLDTKTLEGMLNYSTQPYLLNKKCDLNYIFWNIIALYTILNKSVLDLSLASDGTSKNLLSVFKGYLQQNSKIKYSLLNKYTSSDAEIDCMLDRIKKDVETTELRSDGFLIESYISRINELEAYISKNSREVERPHLIKTIYTLFAIVCGSTLAAVIPQELINRNDNKLHLLDSYLSEGV